MGNSDFLDKNPMEYCKDFLVISVGTGSPKQENKYSAPMAAKWGVLGWLNNNGGNPLIDSFSQASSDMVDFHASVVFKAFKSEKTYLRIQVLPLTQTNVISLSLSLSLISLNLQPFQPHGMNP